MTYWYRVLVIGVSGGKKRGDALQKTRQFMSIDSDKSAGAGSTAGAASIAGSDVAGQIDSSSVTKVLILFSVISNQIVQVDLCQVPGAVE